MTDASEPIPQASSPSTYEALTALADAVFATGLLATPEQATKLRAVVDRLLRPNRQDGSDPEDPAYKAMMDAILYQQQQNQRRRRRRNQ